MVHTNYIYLLLLLARKEPIAFTMSKIRSQASASRQEMRLDLSSICGRIEEFSIFSSVPADEPILEDCNNDLSMLD